MSMDEILAELPKLSPEDRHLLRQELDAHFIDDFEETPEMLAAIDEGLKSSAEGKNITIEELEERMKSWNFKSPDSPRRARLGANRSVYCRRRS